MARGGGPVSGWLGLCRWMYGTCCLKAGARVSRKMCVWVRGGGHCHVRCGVSPTYGPTWVDVDAPPPKRHAAIHVGDAGRCLRRSAAPPASLGSYCCRRCTGFAKGLVSAEYDRGVLGCSCSDRPPGTRPTTNDPRCGVCTTGSTCRTRGGLRYVKQCCAPSEKFGVVARNHPVCKGGCVASPPSLQCVKLQT